MQLPTSVAGSDYHCNSQKASNEGMLTAESKIKLLFTTPFNEEFILKNSPFENMSVTSMAPTKTENCIYTYLRLKDAAGKDIELLVSYPNSKMPHNNVVDYVDIGEWNIITKKTGFDIDNGRLLVFNSSDRTGKRFVLQRPLEN